MAIVLLIMLLLSLLLKRAKGVIGINSKHLSTLASIPIGTKEKLLMIKMGNKKILLGVTQHNIRTLHVEESYKKEKESVVKKDKPPFINELMSARKINK